MVRQKTTTTSRDCDVCSVSKSSNVTICYWCHLRGFRMCQQRDGDRLCGKIFNIKDKEIKFIDCCRKCDLFYGDSSLIRIWW